MDCDVASLAKPHSLGGVHCASFGPRSKVMSLFSRGFPTSLADLVSLANLS